MKKKKPFGETLIEKKVISPPQLKTALQTQKKEGGTLGQALVKLGYISEEEMSTYLSEYYGIPYVDISEYEVDPSVCNLIPEHIARKYRIIPLDKMERTLTVATADATDVFLRDELRILTGCEITTLLAQPNEIEKALERYYGKKATMEETLKEISEGKEELEVSKEKEESVSASQLQAAQEQAPVVKLVNFIIMQAIEDRASDIHIEPYEKNLRLRYRIDGVLYEINPSPPKTMQGPIAARIKILSKLDIAETRIPQDGRIRVKTKEKIVDLRVSTFPTVFGEKIVMRLLDKSSLALDLTKLGFEKEELDKFEKAISSPYGMILITGPTGSGKSTTLYSVLTRLNTIRDNIVTVEDPVEYQVRGINQVQVNPEIGMTFAAGLRAILRQDPNIVMVGEIRDKETAGIAIKAALTGHLVLSTLHTNDSCGAISRLIDIGMEPFMVSSAVTIIGAQRLLRRICPQCKESYVPSASALEKIGIVPQKDEKILFFRGTGCEYCKNTGYRGRLAVYEVLALNKRLRELIIKRANTMVLQDVAKKETGLRTLRESALVKVRAGVTTIEEALSITMEEEL